MEKMAFYAGLLDSKNGLKADRVNCQSIIGCKMLLTAYLVGLSRAVQTYWASWWHAWSLTKELIPGLDHCPGPSKSMPTPLGEGFPGTRQTIRAFSLLRNFLTRHLGTICLFGRQVYPLAPGTIVLTHLGCPSFLHFNPLVSFISLSPSLTEQASRIPVLSTAIPFYKANVKPLSQTLILRTGVTAQFI